MNNLAVSDIYFILENGEYKKMIDLAYIGILPEMTLFSLYSDPGSYLFHIKKFNNQYKMELY